ncbi:EF-hand domain-containing protein [Thermomonas alba]|uniref:EF-hand domain-containing protein n=1 Tax=Thermomonas alba TaxID=2888525 RepID=UPI001F037677|nr:EF-hand domain-containing protein [Thermomonas alba]
MTRAHRIALLLAGLLPIGLLQAQTKPAAPAPSAAKPDPVAATFKAWDKNGDGQLSLAEFRAGWEQMQAALRVEQALRRQFATLDANHDGAIDASEYGNLVLIKQAGKAAPPLARFDANGDGKLDFSEYVKLVQALAPQQDVSKGGKK